jgi:hypothetical protein
MSVLSTTIIAWVALKRRCCGATGSSFATRVARATLQMGYPRRAKAALASLARAFAAFSGLEAFERSPFVSVGDISRRCCIS